MMAPKNKAAHRVAWIACLAIAMLAVDYPVVLLLLIFGGVHWTLQRPQKIA
jgi:hypothetical protein